MKKILTFTLTMLLAISWLSAQQLQQAYSIESKKLSEKELEMLAGNDVTDKNAPKAWTINYAFAQDAATYTAITGGTLHGSGTTVDDNNYNAVNIGFTFTFNGLTYTQLGINANGFLRLGGTAYSGSAGYAPISGVHTQNPPGVIAALGADLVGNAGSSLRSELIGVAPNRIFVIQWTDFQRYLDTGDNFNFQIRLHETTNAIELVYGAFTKNANARAAQVGLRGDSNVDYYNRTTTTNWATTTAGVANNATCALTATVVPTSGLVFRYTPITPPAIDAGITAITSPVNGLAGTQNVVVTLRNFGTTELTACPIHYDIDGVTGVYNWTGSLAYNATANVTIFENFNFSEVKNYVVAVNTNLPGDEDATNDLFSKTVSIFAPFTVPFVEKFDAVTAPALPARWARENLNGDANVWVTSTSNPRSAPNCVRLLYNSAMASNDWLFTPHISIEVGKRYNLSFYYRAAGAYNERLKVHVGSQQTNTAMDATPLVNLVDFQNTTYVLVEHVFIADASKNIVFGFHGYSAADMWAIHIDDISLTEVFDNDAAVLGFNLKSIYGTVGDIVPAATIKNNGLNIASFDVILNVYNSEMAVVETQTVAVTNLASGTSQVINFMPFNLAVGSYSATAEIVWASDEYIGNNMISRNFNVYADIIVHYDDMTNNNAIGAGANPFDAAIRYLPEGKFIHGEGSITHVRVYIAQLVTSHTIKIWQGANAATEVYSQPFTPVANSWNTVVLNTPYEIDTTQELWVGLNVVGIAATFPIGIDATTNVDNFSNMSRVGAGAWTPLSAYGIAGDWNIQFVFKELELSEVPFATAFGIEAGWNNPGGSWTGYNEKTYTEGEWYFHSTAAVRGTPTDAGELTYDGSPYTMRDRGIFTVTNNELAKDMIGFSFQLRDWMTGEGVNRDINVSYNGGTTWDLAGTINKAYFDAYQVYQPFVYYFGEVKNFLPGELVIQIVGGTGANASRINIGQFRALDVEQALISPVVATYDIYNQYDVEVDITWGSATAIASVVESGTPLEATEFAVDVDLLSIKADYFVGMAAGTQVFFTVNFDNGDKSFLRVTITNRTPIITWPTATDIYFGEAFGESVLENGLAVDPADGVTEIAGTFAFVNPTAVAPSAGTWNVDVMFTPNAYQSNNPVYGTVDVIVNKAFADITISDLDYVYDYTAKSATVVTDPGGLVYTITYDGSADLPVEAGTYEVVVTIVDDNYQGVEIASLVIEKAPLTITAESFSKTVGIDLTFIGTEFTYTGTLYGDDDVASVTLTSDGAVAGAVVGDYDIVPSDAVGVGVDNYDITYVNGTLTVTNKITLTLVDLVADNKVYNNTTAATIANFGTLTGVEIGDDVSLVTTAAVATFNNRHVGVGKLVTVTGLALEGVDADKYIINNQTTTANITARPLTLSSFTANNKVYDGTTAVTGTGFADDRIAGNVLAFTFTAAFEDKNAEVDKDVNYTAITISGGVDMLNYALVSTVGTAIATISPKALTVTGAVAQNKVYDGSAVAEITGAVLTGVIAPDDVVLENETEGTFAQAAAGTGLVVTTAMTISGLDADNYTLTQPTLTADITPKALTVTGAVAQNKVYDATTAAVITGATLEAGVIGDDEVVLTNHATGTFAQAGIGTGIAVSTAMTLTGVDAGNYSLTQPVGLTANITAKALTVTGAVAQNKVYDGTTAAVITGATLSGAIVGDIVTLANHAAGTFAQAGIGTGIAVSTAMTLTGTHAANYTLTQPAGLTANITAKGLTIGGTFTVANKVYDGTTAATITNNSLTLVGVVGAETVTLANVVATFANAGPGNNIIVTITSANITGAAAANYTLSLAGAPTTTANIFAVTYTLALEVTPADAGTVTGEGDYEEGEEVTVIATAAEGYIFINWIDEDDVVVSTEATYTFDMPAADLTLTAVFEIEPAVIDPSVFNISLYPNPSRGNFTVTSDVKISEVSVFNLIGKVVYTASTDSNVVELNISGIETGIYFVKVTTENGTSTLKLQINK
ncbi:MAG: T9SS type A sorting domain-containing protein [Bacteroidetes bacterium]|nr:T9SS type A sorting domain-containing protein [Bacteroidota bacterium]